jgi:hypothetical protein
VPVARATVSQGQGADALSSSSIPREASTSYVVREKQGHFRQDDEDGVAAEIKVKKRLRVNGEAEKLRQAEEEKKRMMPAWTPMRLDAAGVASKEKVEITPFGTGEGQHVELAEEQEERKAELKVNEEEEKKKVGNERVADQPTPPPSSATPIEAVAPSTSLFKKRKAGAGAGAKRVKAVI